MTPSPHQPSKSPRVWEVEIYLPPKGVSPNRKSSEHWSHRHRAVRDYKYSSFLSFRKAQADGLLPWGVTASVTIHADFYMAPRLNDGCCRPRDCDNAQGCLKPAIDALVDAGVLQDDSAKYVHTGQIRLFSKRKDHQGRHCVVLRIEESGG